MKTDFPRFASKPIIERKEKPLKNGNDGIVNKLDDGNRKLFESLTEEIAAEDLRSPNLDKVRANKKREFKRVALNEECEFDNLKQRAPVSDINDEVAAADGSSSQDLASEESKFDNLKQGATVSDINE